MQASTSENKKSASEILKIQDKLKNDNPDALNKLFYEFYDDLYFYGTNLSNDNDQITDSIQEVFIYLWESRKLLSKVLHLKAYIYKIFRNRLSLADELPNHNH